MKKMIALAGVVALSLACGLISAPGNADDIDSITEFPNVKEYLKSPNGPARPSAD